MGSSLFSEGYPDPGILNGIVYFAADLVTKNAQKWLEGKTVRKVIVVPGSW